MGPTWPVGPRWAPSWSMNLAMRDSAPYRADHVVVFLPSRWRHKSAMASQITSLTIVYSTVYSRRRSKKTSKLRVTGLCEGNSPVTGEFPAQRASNAENVSIWWRQHALMVPTTGNLIVSSPYMESILVSTMNQRWRGLFHHLSLIQTPNKVMAHKGRHTSWLGITP